MTRLFQCPDCYAALLPSEVSRDWWETDGWAPCGHPTRRYLGIDLAQAETARLYTIGYSQRRPPMTFSPFLAQLEKQQIGVVVDIRRTAWSHKPDFRRARLETLLPINGITYWHCPALGTDKVLRRQLANTRDYAAFFAAFRVYLEEQQPALRSVAALLADRQAVALLCTEARAEECHRSVVAEAVFTLLGGKPGLVHL